MVLSNRTKISLIQFLGLFELSDTNLMFEKYSMDDNCTNIDDIKKSIMTSSTLDNLLSEIISTKQELRSKISPKYRFDERWDDFAKCLFLDGYKIVGAKLVTLEPTIDGVLALEDDLTNEIKNSTLYKQVEIIKLIEDSANSFKKSDFNGCLSNARIAIETMVRAISEDKFSFQDIWGRSLSKLKTENFITKDEENAISATYTFVSNGSHGPLGFTDEEYARYGRNLIMGVCYYMIKKYKQKF
ncbi:MAG: hypothetical protein J0647_00745 [Campylobacteraceae bacterium]|nr:hypothetical protein [Campylobacteraceae bacterium]